MASDTLALPAVEFEYPSDFGRLNAEAQRRNPEQIRPPYLTWHFSCWPRPVARDEPAPNLDRKPGADHFVREKTSWLAAINGFLDILGVAADQRFELADDASGQQAKSPFVKRDSFTFFGLGKARAVVMRCEYHAEYVSFTFFHPVAPPKHAPLQDNRKDVEPRQAFDPFTYQAFLRTDPAVDALVDHVFEEMRHNSDNGEEIDAFTRRASKAWDRLFDEAWRHVFRPAGGGSPLQAPGPVFANYRGIILPRIWLAGAGGSGEMAKHLAVWGHNADSERFIGTDLTDKPSAGATLPKREGHELDPPDEPRRWNRVSAGRALQRNTALRHALHWPGAAPPVDFQPAFRRRTVANLVLDGRALFASSFGGGLPVDLPPDNPSLADPNRTAGRYAVFYCAEHNQEARTALDRRLDRLVLRLHTLGTLRMISLKSLDQLWNASYRLRDVDARIQHLANNGQHGARKSSAELEAISAALSAVNTSVDDGLDFRLSRSHYYARDFKRLLADISIDRIEGWEPYDEFVRRRLFTQWDHLHQIGMRADGVRSRFDRLLDISIARGTEGLTRVAVRLGALAISVTVFAWMFATLTEAELASPLGRPGLTGLWGFVQAHLPAMLLGDVAMRLALCLAAGGISYVMARLLIREGG